MFPFSSPATTKFETFPKTIGSIIDVVNLVIKENLLIQDDQKQLDMSSGLYSSSKFFGSSNILIAIDSIIKALFYP